MPMRILRLAALPLIVLSYVLFSYLGADAQSASPIDLRLQAMATDVATVEVVATTTLEIDGAVSTVAEAQVQAADEINSDTVLIQVDGGVMSDGSRHIVSHQPHLEAGDRLQVALLESPSQVASRALPLAEGRTVYTIVGGIAGVYDLGGGVDTQVANAAGDFALTGARMSFPADYRIRATGSGVGTTATRNAVRAAMDAWENDSGSAIDFTYRGATTARTFGDSINSVYWTSTRPNETFLAQAQWVATTDGNIIEFDVRFNTDYSWSAGARAGHFDITSVMLHETGHALGLAHTSATSEIMHFQIPVGATKGLGAGDRSGVNALYPDEGLDSPNPGSTLACSNVTFNWSGASTGTYAVHLGSNAGGTQYVRTSVGSALSYTFANPPTNGSTVHFRLWYRPPGGSYSIVDQASFSACNQPISLSPASGTTLSCNAPVLNWSGPSNGTYAVHVGSSNGGTQYARTSVGSAKTFTISNAPTNGTTVYVRLWYRPPGGKYTIVDTATYAGCSQPKDITSPTPGSTLPCGPVTLSWSGPASGTYAIHAGTAPGGTQYVRTSTGSNRTLTVNSFPSDGTAVYVRLWHRPVGGKYAVVDTVSYTGCDEPMEFSTPAPGSNLPCTPMVTFTWTGGPVVGTYAIHAGSSPTTKQYAATSTGTAQFIQLGTMPDDGSLVYLKLWYRPPGGSYAVVDTAVYTACSL